MSLAPTFIIEPKRNHPIGWFLFGFIPPLCKHYYFREIVLRTVKSASQVKSKTKVFGEIKSTHSPSRRISLHTVEFHRRRRFHPPVRVDLVENDRFLSKSVVFMEVPPRFELGNESFADSCLTAWPRYRLIKTGTQLRSYFILLERVTRLELATSTLARWRSTG